MPRLLTSEGRSVLRHRQPHRSVAYRAANHLHVFVGEGPLETEVAHHGGDHSAAGKAVVVAELPRPGEEDVVTIQDAPVLVDQDGAICVTVEGDPGLGAKLDDGLGEVLRCRRAAVEVDVVAIRVGGDGGDPRAEPFEKPAGDSRCCSVGRIHHNVEPREGVLRAMTRDKKIQITLAQSGVHRRQPGSVGGFGLRDLRLEVAFALVGQLFASRPEDLDAVVLGGVVGRGNDHTRGAVSLPQEV